MSYDGNGNYTVPAGTAATTGAVIDSAKYNALLADLQVALTKGFLRDGQSAALANLPMGGFKLTGLAAGSAASDSVRMDQLTAGNVVNTPAGNIAATTVQTALNELDTEKAKTGLATASGLTMSTARVLGRTTAATGAVEELTAAQIATFADAVTTAGSQTISGAKTFSTAPILGSAPFPLPSGSAPVYGARAWCVFNGTTAGTNAPTAGGNVATVQRVSTGVYTVTFSTAMPTANYAYQVTCGNTAGGVSQVGVISAAPGTGSFTFTTTTTASGASVDPNLVNVTVIC